VIVGLERDLGVQEKATSSSGPQPRSARARSR
jgi:hypothetical protein